MRTGIYEIINLVNNKCYIGSSVNLDKRHYEHFNALCRNKHGNKKFQNSFNKYKKENFIFEILLECDKDDLLVYEDYFIGEFKPELNLQLSATRRTGSWIPSKETIKRMADGHRGRTTSKKGSKLPEWHRNLNKEVNIGNQNASRVFNVNLKSPSGEIICGEIKNLAKFCRDNGIKSDSTFGSFLKGKKKSYGKWRLM